jgi:hypothetical protein
MSDGRVFSNFNEQEIVKKYVRELSIENTTLVDIGAGDGIRSSNTFGLITSGWTGVAVEYSPRAFAKLARAFLHYPNAFACRFKVTPDNIVGLLGAYGVEKEFGVLSLDIDSYDYYVLDTVLGSFRPRLVITEINEKVPPPIRFVADFDAEFEMKNHFFGYSITALADLLKKHGYALLELEYNNAFIAPEELAGVTPVAIADAYRKGYLDRPDRREKFRPNANMEVLHGMTAVQAVKFLDQFYSEFRGKYQISIEEQA